MSNTHKLALMKVDHQGHAKHCFVLLAWVLSVDSRGSHGFCVICKGHLLHILL